MWLPKNQTLDFTDVFRLLCTPSLQSGEQGIRTYHHVCRGEGWMWLFPSSCPITKKDKRQRVKEGRGAGRTGKKIEKEQRKERKVEEERD